MTLPDRDYDDVLSRLLHSTLDPIEPAGDGLAKIQRRIAEPWLKRQWSLFRAEGTALGWLILVRCEPFANQVRSRLRALAVSSGRRLRSTALTLYARTGQAASGRHRDTGDDDGPAAVLRRWLAPTMTWLRPALAVAGAVVIVVVGVFALGQFRATFLPAAAHPGGSVVAGASHPGSGGVGAIGGHSNSQHAVSGPGSEAPGHKQGDKPSAGANSTSSPSHCTPSPGPAATPSGTPTPSPSPSPTPTATPSTSPTASPTSSGGPVPPGASKVTDDDVTCASHVTTGQAGRAPSR
jgi:hypothetical protein